MMNSQIIETHIITAEMFAGKTYAQRTDAQLQVPLSQVFGPEKNTAWLQTNEQQLRSDSAMGCCFWKFNIHLEDPLNPFIQYGTQLFHILKSTQLFPQSKIISGIRRPKMGMDITLERMR